jgi:hypothetical protein
VLKIGRIGQVFHFCQNLVPICHWSQPFPYLSHLFSICRNLFPICHNLVPFWLNFLIILLFWSFFASLPTSLPISHFAFPAFPALIICSPSLPSSNLCLFQCISSSPSITSTPLPFISFILPFPPPQSLPFSVSLSLLPYANFFPSLSHHSLSCCMSHSLSYLPLFLTSYTPIPSSFSSSFIPLIFLLFLL